MKNGKNLKVKALVDSECTHTGMNKQLVKNKRIQTKLINFSFEVFNADRTKNGEVTRVVPLEIEINGHKEQLEAAITDLNEMDMFLEYDWLVKHNPEVNQENKTVTNFVQLVSPQPVGRFLQTNLCWKAPNQGYPHICRMYKSNNK